MTPDSRCFTRNPRKNEGVSPAFRARNSRIEGFRFVSIRPPRTAAVFVYRRESLSRQPRSGSDRRPCRLSLRFLSPIVNRGSAAFDVYLSKYCSVFEIERYVGRSRIVHVNRELGRPSSLHGPQLGPLPPLTPLDASVERSLSVARVSAAVSPSRVRTRCRDRPTGPSIRQFNTGVRSSPARTRRRAGPSLGVRR